MAHAAIAYAKAHMRRRMMACTTSIGPGATNLVTAAALAHVNRLPVLLLPGDIFVTRAPDPVLQQVEDFQDGTVSANDCFRPVSRYFDRIAHPAQLLTALPRAIRVLTDPALCGPVTLALPQDVQAMAFDYPAEFFAPAPCRFDGPPPIAAELAAAARLSARGEAAADRRRRRRALRAGDRRRLRAFADAHGIPVAETQAGKGALAVGPSRCSRARSASPARRRPTRSRATRTSCSRVGTRLQDFTTGSHSLFAQARARQPQRQPLRCAASGAAIDAVRRCARRRSTALSHALVGLARRRRLDRARARQLANDWRADVARITGQRDVGACPYEGDVIGAVQRSAADSPAHDIVVCAAGTLPAELHKLWRTSTPGGYHMEYGYSCMGYEIAGGLGVKMAQPDREVDRDGRRRQLPDAELRDRDVGDARHEAHRRRARQPRLRLHQPAAAGVRRRAVQQPARGLRAARRRGAPAIDFAAHARALGARARERREHRRARSGAARARARRTART